MSPELVSSYRFCDDLSRREAKNFYYSFRLLPADRRASMTALYAFLRRTDDIADEPGTLDAKRAGVEQWRTALDDAIAGRGQAWPGLPALADIVEKHAIPVRYLIEVIDGVEMDLTRSTYATFDELHSYCYRVASAVGLSCLHVWGFRSDEGHAERLAEDLGIALQLTNILRDVREDALRERIYLPLEDLDRFGVAPSSFVASTTTPAHRRLFEFEATRARAYYEQAVGLERNVDPVGRPVLATIRGIYAALLDEIERAEYKVLECRRRVSSWKKSWIMLNAWLQGGRSSSIPARVPEPEARR
ncbi:MAG: phytoene/squalene synthase family protein [Isosphaeraceae bacterium]|nr:phytoene/squalene synthase family protein [Isosphaeraceae bacterium]